MRKDIARLIQTVCEGKDMSERREAVIELGYEKDDAVYRVLVEQLNDPSKTIQHAAVISLGRYGNPSAIEELVKPKILHSPVVNIRWAALVSLGILGDYRIIDHLLKSIGDPEWIVRNQAVTELKEKIQEIMELKDYRHVRILIRLLALDNDEIIDLAVEGLSALKEKSVDLLLEALKSPSLLMRKNAARVLGQIKTDRALPPLIDLLLDPNWEVRKSAVEALGNIGHKLAIEPLVQRLGDNVESVRNQAMKSIIGFGISVTQPLLNALSHEKNKYALRVLLLTVGEIGDTKAIPYLIDYLKSSYFIVRIAATNALIKFGPEMINPLVSTLSTNKSNIRLLLRDAANHKNVSVQIRAIKALGGLEEHRAVRLLKNLVEKGSLEIQEAAEQALVQIGCAAWGRCGVLIVLSKIGHVALIPHFIHALRDDSNNVRLEAVRALASVGGPDAIYSLISVVKKDRDPYIRQEAMRYLRSIGVGYSEVLGLALSALEDSFHYVRSEAARLLGNFQNDRSIQPLLKATADVHWSVRESAEIALLNFGSRAVPQLIDALSSRFWTTRFRAARLLGKFGDIQAVESLEKLLKVRGERQEVKKMVRETLALLRTKIAA
ncbi:HEAT repeat domain-containing protein [bacterium]|nr:HEAT repeat domain-containing protein [bacterium]